METKQIQILLGTKMDKLPVDRNLYIHKKEDPLYVDDDQIPSTFDSRKQWKNCSTIGDIPNQGNCGSCWVSLKNQCILRNRKILIPFFSNQCYNF